MRLVNQERYPFPSNPFFVHIATIKDGLSDLYVYFQDTRTSQTYIERVVGAISPTGEVEGFLEQIGDDVLWAHLAQFIQKLGLDKMLDKNSRPF